MRGRRARAAGAAVLLLAVTPPAVAGASIASVSARNGRSTLNYIAATGETNRTSIEVQTAGLIAKVFDSGNAITAGKGCRQNKDRERVSCLSDLTTLEIGGFGDVDVTLADGNDALSVSRERGTFRTITVRAGSGDDALDLANVRVSGPVDVLADSGNDYVNLSNAQVAGRVGVAADSGNDLVDLSNAQVADRVDIRGDAGNDVVKGSLGFDSIEGGPGDDDLHGGGGSDFVNDNGGGADALFGGPGLDAVQYSCAIGSAGPTLSVTLDDVANDGVPGEGDNVHSDIERVFGNACGSNVIMGSAVRNELVGGQGSDYIDGGAGDDIIHGMFFTNAGHAGDTLIGGPGSDAIVGWDGDDSIDARDGELDSVRCNGGNDTAYVDAAETEVVDCETVVRG